LVAKGDKTPDLERQMGILDFDISTLRTALDMGAAADRHAIALGKLLDERPKILRRRGKAGEDKKDGGQFAAHGRLLFEGWNNNRFEKRS
jgi:hypothetical protein